MRTTFLAKFVAASLSFLLVFTPPFVPVVLAEGEEQTQDSGQSGDSQQPASDSTQTSESSSEPSPSSSTDPSPTPGADASSSDTGGDSTNDSTATSTTDTTVTNENQADVQNNVDGTSNTGENTIAAEPTPTPTPTEDPQPSPTPTPAECPEQNNAESTPQSSESENSETGDGTTNTSTSTDQDTATVTNTNCAEISETNSADSSTGQNTDSGNEDDVTVDTGNAAGSATTGNEANFNSTDVSGNTSAEATNTNTGSDSTNTASSTTSDSVSISNTNVVNAESDVSTEGSSGENMANGNEDDVSVTTGDVDVAANLANLLNINLSGSDFLYQVLNIYSDLTGDLNLDSLAASLGMTTAELIALAENSQTGDGSTNTAEATASQSLEVSNDNTAVVENDLSATGVSGQNEASANEDNVSIITGRVKVLLRLLNFINANFTGNHWYFAMINLFANMNGNIILPEADEFLFGEGGLGASAANENTGDGSQNSASATSSQTTNVSNQNEATLINNVNLYADSGNNQASGNEDESSITTGAAEVITALINWVNLNLTGNNWIFLVINVMGTWVGNLIAFPGVALFAPAPGSPYGTYAYLATGSGGQGAGGAIASNSNTGEGSENSATASVSQSLDVSNANSATVINNVSGTGISGQNQANGNEDNVSIVTGAVSILAQILNLININATGNYWLLLFINIFGNLNGDIVFPHPDLTLSITDGADSASPGDTLTYTITYRNLSSGKARDVRIEVPVPESSSFLSASDGGALGSPIHWDLGTMLSGEEKTVSFAVQVDSSFQGTLLAFASVSTSTTEPDTSNNSASDTTNIVIGGSPSEGSPSPGDSGSSGSSSDSSSSSGTGETQASSDVAGPQVLGLSDTSGESAKLDGEPQQANSNLILALLLIFAYGSFLFTRRAPIR